MNLFTSHTPSLLTVVRAPQVIVRNFDDLSRVARLPHVVYGVVEGYSGAVTANDPDHPALDDYYELFGVPLGGPNVYRSSPLTSGLATSANDLLQVGRPSLLLIPKVPLYMRHLGSVAVASQALAARERGGGVGENAALWAPARAARALLNGEIALGDTIEGVTFSELERRQPAPGGRAERDGAGDGGTRLGRVVVDIQALGHTLPNQPLALVLDLLPRDEDGRKLRTPSRGRVTVEGMARKLDESVATPVGLSQPEDE